ncbi:MAG: flippase-like domain-containing protein [Myxococcales bacterium]|nr:flippase-like domain-containing protein [Myxococcales bacterium]
MTVTARARRIALGLAVSAGLLAAILAGVDGEAAWARLRQADGLWLVISFLVSAAVLWARGLRFWGLSSQSSLGTVTAAIALQNALTRVTPLRLGELSLPYALHRVAGEPAAPALVHLVLVRLVELWVLTCAATVAGLIWFGAGPGGQGIAGGVLLGGLAVMTAALAFFRPLLAWAVRLATALAGRLGLDGKPAVGKALAALAQAADGSNRLDGRRRRWLVGGTLAVMALQFILYYALLRACGLDLAPAQVVVGSAGAQVAGALPVVSVGSLGTHETGWTAAMTWVGLGFTDAVISGLFTQLVTLVFAAVFVPAAWWGLARAQRGFTGEPPARLRPTGSHGDPKDSSPSEV